jgi:SAM-dependent methyltransferase
MQMDLVELTRPLPPFHAKAVKYGLARLFIRTVARLSKGIDIGCTHGFDSGVMLDHVYENRAEGRFLIGRLIDRVYLDAPGWSGIRNRGELLCDVIVAEAVKTADGRRPVRIVDLACGGGRYLLAALRRLRDTGIGVQATLRDYRAENIAKAQENAARAGIEAAIEAGDAFSDADLARLASPELGSPDVVVVSGLHEIIDDDQVVRRHFAQIAGLLPFGGRLIVTLQPDHPQVEFIARVLTSHSGRPWAMRLRPVALIRHWAEEAGFVVETVTMERRGIFGVLVARKV